MPAGMVMRKPSGAGSVVVVTATVVVGAAVVVGGVVVDAAVVSGGASVVGVAVVAGATAVASLESSASESLPAQAPAVRANAASSAARTKGRERGASWQRDDGGVTQWRCEGDMASF